MDPALTVLAVFAAVALAAAGAVAFISWSRRRRLFTPARRTVVEEPGRLEVVRPPDRVETVHRVEERRESTTRRPEPPRHP
ncbi:MAG TPA: hypothetical protein VHI93_09185 [Candidatus Thermoplasmatota archaeon]|nr:hypothetical protein [Candidatus Thermoplasmatota archaeon]